METARDIIVFAASQAFASVSRRLIEERGLSGHIAVVEATGEQTLKYAEDFARAGSRIFISRGRNSGLLRDHISIPLIDVPYLYEEIYDSVEATGAKPEQITLIGFDKAYDIMMKFKRLSGLDVQVLEPQSPDTMEEELIQAIRPGTKALVGGLSVRRVAAFYHLSQSPLMVEPANVSLAIDSALNILASMEKKDEYLTTISATINRMSNAVLNFDQSGNLLFSNDRARRLMAAAGGDGLRKLILPSEESVSQTPPPAVPRERILTIGSSHYMAEYLPVIVNKKVKSTVVIISSENSIQSAEKRLRLNQMERGYTAKNSFCDIIGSSPALKNTIRLAKKYARSQSAVLITGETGTGKELFSQSIHNESSRADEPFVAVNCAALPQSLLESELFGYVKGAFTGASKEGKMGIFEMAHKGTVFLDEIGEMDLNVQAKLLRVLQEREVCRLGDDRVIPVDIRIISATNKDLEALVAEKKFREDLLYRLNVLELRLPPLRERQADIPELTVSYLSRRSSSGSPVSLTKEAVSLLSRGAYPGNIRQLFNLLERILTLAESEEIGPEDLLPLLPWADEKRPVEPVLSQSLDRFEKERIETALRKNQGSRARTAKELQISTATLWRKMKKYDIRPF